MSAVLLLLAGCGLWADDDDRHHPPGYEEAEQHGLESNLKEQICVNCHAADLTGDPEIGSESCDECHHDEGEDPTAWRTDCTFCHGGMDDTTGAPPEDLHSEPTDTTFGAHTAHVSGTAVRTPLGCEGCHVTPEDVLSVGHMWDATPGVSEVDFSGSLSPEAVWQDATCSSVYCHGDGQQTGSIAADAADLGCTTCHAGQDSDEAGWAGMSRLHAEPHLRGEDGVVATCSDCHAGTVAADDATITGLDRHIDGAVDVAIDEGDPEITLTWDPGAQTCDGDCHGVTHHADRWTDTLSPHPDGFEEPESHGLEAKLDVLTEEKRCAECHGEDLTGEEGNGISCDTCHNEDEPDLTAWRTDCTFCHGGTDNPSGAPPEDIHDAKVDSAFGPHTAHISGATVRSPLPCTSCHVEPEDVLSVGHMWDGTAGVAETDFSAGLSPKNVWSGGTCSSSYCHGDGQGHSGTVEATDTDLGCTSCHLGQESAVDLWVAMSGAHSTHLRGPANEVATCSECHADTVDIDDVTIVGLDVHLDGTVDIALSPEDATATVTYSPKTGTCDGDCHGERHRSLDWFHED